jgi:TRAP-type C4-dicarboxylate transport system substrate-binding protein
MLYANCFDDGGIMRKYIVFILLFILINTGLTQVKIKFATLATEGSTWMNVMKEYVQAVSDATGGKVKFQIFPGGVQGDELVVLRKIRIGQLHSGGFTGVGLGEILPEVRILDSPFLFKSYDEVDHVTSGLFDYFAQKFEEKGYILLGWAEVGFVYVFTNKPIRKLEDMRGVKMWMWEGDPVAEATFRALDISPIPLSITDVLTSLQTNLIDGVYISPFPCVALQWYTRVKNMLDLPLADSNGAVLISKRQFNKLDDSQKKILKDLSRDYFGKLTRLSREDNAESLKLIRESGIEITKIDDADIFYSAGQKARRSLIGKLYDKNFLDRVESTLMDYRSQQNTQGNN